MTISPDSIKIRKTAADSIVGFKKLKKLRFFEDKILTAVLTLLRNKQPLSFANLTLSVAPRRDENQLQNITEVGKFLLHIHQLGVNFCPKWVENLETELITNYFNPQLPTKASNAKMISNALQRILMAGKQLNVDFKQISAFNQKLPELIEHAATAKLVEKARQIIMDSNLVGTILPSSEPSFLAKATSNQEIIQLEFSGSVDNLVLFQNFNLPISQRCAEVWKIIDVSLNRAKLNFKKL